MKTTKNKTPSMYNYDNYIFLLLAVRRLYGYGYGLGVIKVS